MSDDAKPAFINEQLGFMQTAGVAMLVSAASGRLDLNDLARYELASRGLDHDGEWVGFSKARELYERVRNPSRVNEGATVEESKMTMIDVTITARMFIDPCRPAMDQDEQHQTAWALRRAVRRTLFDAFLCHEPVRSMAHIRRVMVTFSGHVTT